MRRALKFTKNAYVFQSHLIPTFTSRFKSDSAKSADKAKKEAAAKLKKAAAPSKPKKDAVASKPKKDAVASKQDKPKKAVVALKDETKIAGGTKCQPKAPPPKIPPESQKRVPKEDCDTLIFKKPGTSTATKRKVPLTKIQGGALDCPKPFKAKAPISHHAQRYRKLSLFLILPLVAILTLLILGSRHEGDRLEFKNYEFMYRRTKRFHFGDGNRSAFHNSHWNAIPPEGYEDEVDEEGIGKDKESEQDKKSRLKEFQKVFKDWKKHADKRDARIKKEMAS